MAIPVGVADVERVLRPWLGTLFLSANPLAADVAAHMRAYAPYRQTLESLRDELESLLLVKLNRLTSGSLTVITDNYHTRRLGMGHIAAITGTSLVISSGPSFVSLASASYSSI